MYQSVILRLIHVYFFDISSRMRKVAFPSFKISKFSGREFPQNSLHISLLENPRSCKYEQTFGTNWKIKDFAASSWQDHKHILTLDEIPEQVSILKSPKIQNLLCIELCKLVNARSNSEPSFRSTPCVHNQFCGHSGALPPSNQWNWVLNCFYSERTGTDYENQSATVFIITNHGSEILVSLLLLQYCTSRCWAY